MAVTLFKDFLKRLEAEQDDCWVTYINGTEIQVWGKPSRIVKVTPPGSMHLPMVRKSDTRPKQPRSSLHHAPTSCLDQSPSPKDPQ